MSARTSATLVIGAERVELASIAANGKPVSTAHELAHVIQQRGGVHLEVGFQPGAGKAVSQKFTAGRPAPTIAIEFANSPAVTVAGFTTSTAPAAAGYAPGNTKYSNIKLTRA
jgi:hypothetical protein